MFMRILIAAAALTAGAAVAAPFHQQVKDETTAGRTLVSAAQPVYPPEERGRWTRSCVAVLFTVRADGKTDGFAVLEAPNMKKTSKRVLTETEKQKDRRDLDRFIKRALDAVFQWQYAPAPKATEEIVVVRYETTGMGGQLMRQSVRRLDLGTKEPEACTGRFDPAQVRERFGPKAGKA